MKYTAVDFNFKVLEEIISDNTRDEMDIYFTKKYKKYSGMFVEREEK